MRKGLYRRVSMSFAFSLSTPTTTRSGLMKSLMAFPSLRNSGLLATSNVTSACRLSNSACMAWRTSFAVPTGTVLLVTTTMYLLRCWPMVRATCNTYLRSALPSSSGGVPTAEKTICCSLRTLSKEVVKRRRPALTFLSTNSSRPGS